MPIESATAPRPRGLAMQYVGCAPGSPQRGWSHSADDELSKVVNAVRSATNFDPSGGRAAKRRAAEVEVGPVGPA